MSKEIDITGQKFGCLTVIKKNGHHIRKSGRKDVLWLCQCSCGNLTNVTKANLENGGTISCGCVQKSNRYKPHRDIIIKNYGDYCSIKLYNGEVSLFDTEDLSKVDGMNWHLNKHGYACNGDGIPMHRVILEELCKDQVVHHKDENKLNNRRENLVVMSRKEHTLLHDNLNLSREDAEKALEERKEK